MKTLAEQLHEYLKLRAQKEGVHFDLPREFSEKAAAVGAKIFGVVHDGRHMLRDEQEPCEGFFAEATVEISQR